MSKQGLTEEQIKFIENQRSQGLTWGEVAVLFDEEFEISHTKDSMRLKYNYWAGDEPDYDNIEQLKGRHRAQEAAATARKALKKAVATQVTLEDVMNELKKTAKNIKIPKITAKKAVKGTKQVCTIEALLGDVQLGKVMEDYNSEICGRRLEEYTRCVLMYKEQHEKQGLKCERIVLCLLGDLIEHDFKHHKGSGSVDCSLPEQCRLITEQLYALVIAPLAATGVNVDVLCVTGNHEYEKSGLHMWYPGREHISWTFYNFLSLLCKTAGMKNVNFVIPEGSFINYEIYGNEFIMEHGVGVAANEAAMAKRVQKRGAQLKKHIDFFRMGDKHHIARFNNDRYVINGAMFGADKKGVEYSGILGYDSPPAQIIFAHVPRKKDDPRTSVYDSFTIQLGHIK